MTQLHHTTAGLSTPIDSIFFSERLEFRTIQNDAAGQEDMFQLCREDSFWAGCSGGLLIPADRRAVLKMVQAMQDHCALYVFPYLREEASATPQDPEKQGEGRKGEGTDNDKAARKPLGVLSISKPSLDRRASHRVSELGIALAKEHRGKGYGTEMLRWALDWAFGNAGIHRLQLETESWNAEAWGVYEKVGFTRDGVLREAEWFQGAWWDVYVYGMLEREWAELRGRK